MRSGGACGKSFRENPGMRCYHGRSRTAVPATHRMEGRREQRGRHGGGAKEGSGPSRRSATTTTATSTMGPATIPSTSCALQRVVRGGAAQRLLPLLGAARSRRPRTRVRVRNRKTGEVQRAPQPRLLQLPRHLVPRRGEAGGDRGHRRSTASAPRARRSCRGTFDVHNELAKAVAELQGQGSGHPVPDRVQRERRLHLRASCARATTSSATSTRTPRSWTAPSWPSPRPSSSATTTPWTSSASSTACGARSWWWSRACTRWTATSACCPRSWTWPSATARAS